MVMGLVMGGVCRMVAAAGPDSTNRCSCSGQADDREQSPPRRLAAEGGIKVTRAGQGGSATLYVLHELINLCEGRKAFEADRERLA